MTPQPSFLQRLPRTVQSVAVIIVLLAVGGGAAFLLSGKLAPKPSQPSTSVSGDKASPTPRQTDCTAAPAAPQPVTQPTAGAAPIPGPYWVNTPLGVNLRSGPSATAAKVTTLSQGTALQVTGQSSDAAGNRWDSVSVGSQAGWIRSDFVVPTAIKPVSGTGFSLMIPSGYSWVTTSGVTDVTRPGADLPFLRVQTSTTDTLGVQLPASVRPDVAARPDHTALIQVWDYTVLKRVTRVALNACTVPYAASRPDSGWPYLTSVLVQAKGRVVSFAFFTSTPDDPVVQQVLDSVATP
jgi:hypothetical protein